MYYFSSILSKLSAKGYRVEYDMYIKDTHEIKGFRDMCD
jgi:hypothetical protein